MDPLTASPASMPESVLLATRQRLLEVCHVLGEPDPGGSAHPAELLEALVARLVRSPRRDEAWLLIAALTTVLPPAELVIDFVRQLATSSSTAATLWLLDRAMPFARRWGRLAWPLRIVVDEVVVDVDFSARDEHNSGIQRVVRNTVPLWSAAHELVLVAWGSDGRSWRELDAAETGRVLDWSSADRPSRDPDHLDRLVLPWRSRVLLVEMPVDADECLPLAAIAELSGNHVRMIGYDMIPLTSAETVPLAMADHFAKYLAIVKHSEVVAGISVTAKEEFAGFADMLAAQGERPPRVVSCVLPVEARERAGPEAPASAVPLVLCVGSKEPRKNHLAVLLAAERLWRGGAEFEVLFIGAYGWDTREFRQTVARLKAAGRPVFAPTVTDDDALWSAYARARFTVFPSLHEGYGLPVAESLALGVPVVATEYGSVGEIARGGGCLLVDPRDDDQLMDAMARLLLDDAVHARLVAEARARPMRRWTDYAAELWDQVGAR